MKIRMGIFLAALVLAGCGNVETGSNSLSTGSTASVTEVAPSGPPVEVVPGELIVIYKPSVGKAVHKSVESIVSGSTVLQDFSGLGIAHIKIPAGMTDAEATQMYLDSGTVSSVEPNTIIRIHTPATLQNPNDQYYTNSEWNMPMISAPTAWETTTGSSSVIIGIIDSGIESVHPDLAANWSGYWYNAITSSSTTAPLDDNSHGTHVAGIIGAKGNNSIGVSGVNWNTKIAACKFIGSNGVGTTANAIACVNYFNKLRSQGVNIVAVNNSWGSPSYSQALAAAMTAEPRILHIAAAGNSTLDNDASPNYPASYQIPNMISVAATSKNDTLSVYSDWGRRSVSVGAPGDSILSTVPGKTYNVKSGTSMASPHVAGIVGLLYAANPAMTATMARNLLLSSGDTNAALTGSTITGKRVNVASALACSDKQSFSVIKTPASLTSGTPATFTVLSVKCAEPVSPITVTSSIQNTTYTVANSDGLATFTYTPTSTSDTLTFSSAAGSDAVTISPLLLTSPLPSAFTKGQLVATQLTGSGGTAPYTFTAASLPTGLTLSTAGKLSGTATTTGTFNSTYIITDSRAVQVKKSLTVTVNPAPSITTSSLASGNVGMAYSQTVAATGGTTPLTWKSTSTVSGLSLSSAGILSGTPATAGTTSYNITVTDANGIVATKSVSLIVLTKPTITTALTTYEQGQTITLQLTGSGGSSPYKFSGTQPPGLTMTAGGLITGTFTSSGIVTSNITLTDAKGVVITKPYTFTIAMAPKITTTSLVAGKIATAYTTTFAVSGGTAAYKWTSTSKVPGLALSSAGVLSGKPLTAGSYSYIIKVTDAKGVSATVTLPITITKT